MDGFTSFTDELPGPVRVALPPPLETVTIPYSALGFLLVVGVILAVARWRG